MKIQDQDFYHGAALMQIVEHPSFKALNKGSNKYGHYLINTNCHVFIRYRKSDGNEWTFTFKPEQIEPINNIVESKDSIYLCFVCGEHSICLLNQVQSEVVLNLTSSESQWIKVIAPEGKRFRVCGSNGSLEKTIAHNAFPKKLFDE